MLAEAAAAPPQGVALRRQRPVRVEPGMDEQQAVIVGIGGAAQLGHQLAHGRAALCMAARRPLVQRVMASAPSRQWMMPSAGSPP